MKNLPTLYKESFFMKVKKSILRFFKKEPEEIQLDIKPTNTVKIEEIVQPKNISIVKEKNKDSIENKKIQEKKENKKEISVEDEEKERD